MTDDDTPTAPRPRRSPLESSERRAGDTTSPIALLERDLDPADAVLAERLRETDPAVLAVRLAKELDRERRDRRRREHDSNELENTVARAIAEQKEALDEQKGALEWLRDNVKSLLSSRSIATKAIVTFAGAVSAVLVFALKMLWATADAEATRRTEMQFMQKAQEKQGQIQEKQGAQIEEILRQLYRAKDSNP